MNLLFGSKILKCLVIDSLGLDPESIKWIRNTAFAFSPANLEALACGGVVGLNGAVVAVPALLPAQDVHLAGDGRHRRPVSSLLHACNKLPPVPRHIVALNLGTGYKQVIIRVNKFGYY
jgi:hypothetical protein